MLLGVSPLHFLIGCKTIEQQPSRCISSCAAAGPTLKRARVGARQPKCVVLDIEGTVAPITFVTETLFPYAKSHLRSFLASTFEDPDTRKAVALLREQAVLVGPPIRDQGSPQYR